MTWFQRRNKRRRVSADRSRPVVQGTGLPITPPGKRATRFVMTSVFIAAGLVVLNFPTSGPKIGPGDIAARDYRTLVPFQWLDGDATKKARDDAEEDCLRVFRERTDHLERIPAELSAFLLEVERTEALEELRSEAMRNWNLGGDDLEHVKSGLASARVPDVLAKVESLLTRAGTRGIVSTEHHKREIDAARYDVRVYRGDDASATSERSLWETRKHPDGVRDYFEPELGELLEGEPAEFTQALLKLLTHRATPTLKYDAEATMAARQVAREAVRERKVTIPKGTLLLGKGDAATPEAIDKLRAHERALARQGTRLRGTAGEDDVLRRRLLRAAGVSSLFLVAFVLLAVYTRHFAADVLASNTRVFGAYSVLLLTLAAVRLLEHFGLALQLSPVVLASMVLTVACGPVLACGSSVFLALMIGAVTDRGMALAIPLLIGGLAAVPGLLRVSRRGDALEAGFVAGGVQLLALWIVYLAGTTTGIPSGPLPVYPSIAALGGGVLAGFLLTGMLPYVERFFDVATEVRLLEWTDQNQPLLRKLALEAPGTYHHSTIVSNMAAAAAGAIGANALLARAGGYLHDVGKLNRPEYFIENAGGRPSRHEGLSPSMSSLILTAHTKDGVELAARYAVPSPLRRIIVEHHGTSLAGYFYNKALKDAETNGETVKEQMFRYRGPKPRSPESAIVMLADSAESAARSLNDASPGSIEKLIHDIVENRLKDGQLDESRMTITDIRRVEERLVRSLLAISHPRISYSVPE